MSVSPRTAALAVSPALDDVRFVPPARQMRGTLAVPGDKSISHRAALFNAVADGDAHVTGYAPGGDCASSLACLAQMGVVCEQGGDELVVHGVGFRGLQEPTDVLDCGNSGTTMRLLSGLLAGQGLFAVLSGDGSLRRRPMARVIQPLRQMGAELNARGGDRLPPLVVRPVPSLRGMEYRLPVASAQLKSALLLAGLYAEGSTTIEEPARSRDHTERLLGAMGADVRVDANRITVHPVERLRAVDVAVPGDFSSAAFWLVAACLHPNAEVRVRDVGLNPTRTGLLTILEQMGADVRTENVRDVAGEPVGDVVARSSQLRGTVVEGDLIPLAIDELPLVPLLALFAEGETVVKDAEELRVKESDRVQAVAEGLRALGGDVQPTDDGWIVRPSRLHQGRAASQGDHRLAMMLALAGALGQGAEIEGARAVSVSYPSFWGELERLAAE